LEIKVQPVIKDLQEILVKQALREAKDLKAIKAKPVIKDLQEIKVQLV
jgi:hypothetical protein